MDRAWRSPRSAICGCVHPWRRGRRPNASRTTCSSRRTRPGRPMAASLAFSSDRDGAMDVWVRDLRTGPIAPRRQRRRRRPPGRPTARAGVSRSAVATSRRRRVRAVRAVRCVHERSERTRAPELVAGWPRGGDVGAAPVYSTRFREGTNQVLWVQVEPDPRRPDAGRSRRTAGSTRCRTSRSACARTSARCGRRMAARWPRSSMAS